jgi:hypothetical protein
MVHPVLYFPDVLLTLGSHHSASATVVPPTPEQIVMMKRRQTLEDRARIAFGDTGLTRKLRDWRKTRGFVLVGEEGARSAPRLIVEDEHG